MPAVLAVCAVKVIFGWVQLVYCFDLLLLNFWGCGCGCGFGVLASNQCRQIKFHASNKDPLAELKEHGQVKERAANSQGSLATGTHPYSGQEAAHQEPLAHGTHTQDRKEAQAVGVAGGQDQLANGRGETDEHHEVGHQHQSANEGQLAALPGNIRSLTTTKTQRAITSYGHQESQIKRQQQGQMMPEKDLKELPAG